MSVVNAVPLLEAAGGGYQISRSVRLRSSASAYLTRTPAAAGNLTTWTWSGWVKRGTLSTAQFLIGAGTVATNDVGLYFEVSPTTDTLIFAKRGSISLITTQLFRDPSAWYHIVVAYDSTQGTASNRLKMYVNGSQITSFSTATYPTASETTQVNNNVAQYIGRRSDGVYFDGYLTEINFIDGQALTPSSFGQTNPVTGVWQPIKYTGTYGTNGFYLNFSDNSAATAAAIGKDYSGNGNNWTPNNISTTAGSTYDSMLDVPTPYADGGNGRGNYCVLNPLDKDSGNTVVDGNLKVTTSTTGQGFQRGSIAVSSGKWYWEVLVTSASGNSSIGIAGQNTVANTTNYIGATADSYGYVATNGNKYNNGTNAAYGATYTTNDVIGVALDMDGGTLTFYKNNATQGTAYTGLSGLFAPAVSDVSNTVASIFNVNFGQQPFTYTPPTGFKALNTQNLPDATIKKGNQYFDVVTRSGFGASGGTISSLNFQPDFLWSKSRSAVGDHNLVDAVRGVSKTLYADLTNAEASTPNFVTAFNSNGYTVGSSDWSTSATVAEWLWNAGGNTVSNTSGTITSSVRANPTAGISVVTYTGTGAVATIGHGLGVTPKLIIGKKRSAAGNWHVYHGAISNMASGYIVLNLIDPFRTTSSAVWNNTAPTSSVFTLGTDTDLNTSGATNVAYCFAEVAGFSKFGSYTGNGSADGPFVFLGFRPRYLLVKQSDGAQNWLIFDAVRKTYNDGNRTILTAESSAAEVTDAFPIDFTSNGFKVRNTGTGANTSGGTYIFAAFAENPFKYSLGR